MYIDYVLFFYWFYNNNNNLRLSHRQKEYMKNRVPNQVLPDSIDTITLNYIVSLWPQQIYIKYV
jgi:hypothetical protein